MKSLLLACFVLTILSCNHSASIESRMKNYMTDTVLKKFNDPGSYEFVELKLDSVYNHKITSKYLYDDSLNLNHQKLMMEIESKSLDKEEKEEYLKHKNNIIDLYASRIEQYKKELSEPDYIYRVNGNIKYRAKNKLGALVLGNITLSYNPVSDKITTEN